MEIRSAYQTAGLNCLSPTFTATEKIKVSGRGKLDESSMICDVKIVEGKLQSVAVKTLPQGEGVWIQVRLNDLQLPFLNQRTKQFKS